MGDNVEQQGATPPPRTHKKARAWQVVVLAVLVLITLSLAYWQWTRFRSASGSVQNLGYTLQWPVFGAFLVYAYRSYLKHENELIDSEAQQASEGHRSPSAGRGKMTEIAKDFLPPRPTTPADPWVDDRRERALSADNSESTDQR